MPWSGETCGRCQRRMNVTFHVPEQVWRLVVVNRWRTLCPHCFDLEARQVPSALQLRRAGRRVMVGSTAHGLRERARQLREERPRRRPPTRPAIAGQSSLWDPWERETAPSAARRAHWPSGEGAAISTLGLGCFERDAAPLPTTRIAIRANHHQECGAPPRPAGQPKGGDGKRACEPDEHGVPVGSRTYAARLAERPGLGRPLVHVDIDRGRAERPAMTHQMVRDQGEGCCATRSLGRARYCSRMTAANASTSKSTASTKIGPIMAL